jgi:hypothetical protein
MDQRKLLAAWLLWSLSLALIPLLIPIGRNLEYEYIWLQSLLTTLLTPWFVWWLSRHTEQPWIPIHHLSISCPILIAAPALMLLTSNVCSCSDRNFLLWYMLQFLPAWWIALALSRLSRFHPKTLLTIQLTLILAGISLMWWFPQKRMVHLILGYLHGPIYDRWLPLSFHIILARIAQGLAGLLFFFSFSQQKRRRWILVLAAALCLLPQWFYPELSHGSRALQSLLPKTMNHPHFTLYYRNPKQHADYNKQIRDLFEESRFHVTELRNLLGEKADPPHVSIYVYPANDRKKLWFGGGGTDVTDVVTPSIHIVARRGPHPTLRHELVHALTSSQAFHGLGFHPNMALTEGLAVALAPSRRTRSLDEAAAALLAQNRLPPLEQLLSPLFWLEAGPRAYTAAGSLLNYLIENHGIAEVLALYRGDPSIFDESTRWLASLGEWKATLTARFPPQPDLAAEALYRDPGLFYNRCPHSKALLSRKLNDSWNRWRQPASWQPDQDYWPWRLRLDPGDRRAQLAIFRRQAKKLIESDSPKEAFESLKGRITSVRQQPAKHLEDIELGLLLSDLQRRNEPQTSLKTLAQLKTTYRANTIGHGLTRSIWARWLIEQSALSKGEKRQWRAYLAGWRSLPQAPAAEHSIPWIVHYLRNFRWQGLPAQELIKLDQPEFADKIPQSFWEMWSLNIGYRLLNQDQPNLAASAFREAGRNSQPGHKNHLALLVRYAEFLQQLNAKTSK